MGLSWQQGPLGRNPVGRFLTAEPLPDRLLFAEPLRRRMRVRFAEHWIADSEDVVLLHEPGHYPLAYFPIDDVDAVLIDEDRTTRHRELGDTQWFTVTAGRAAAKRAAWQHSDLPAHADVLRDRVAFAWRAMDAFYEEDERILGHAADPYHRIDIRHTSRHLVVNDGPQVVAETTRPIVLYESGFAPRWYVAREDIDAAALRPATTRTFCPYKGVADYYDIGTHTDAAWTYPQILPDLARVAGLISFEPDQVTVHLDGHRLPAASGQSVIAHGIDRGLDLDELVERHRH